jgi:hypothetical protein
MQYEYIHFQCQEEPNRSKKSNAPVPSLVPKELTGVVPVVRKECDNIQEPAL